MNCAKYESDCRFSSNLFNSRLRLSRQTLVQKRRISNAKRDRTRTRGVWLKNSRRRRQNKSIRENNTGNAERQRNIVIVSIRNRHVLSREGRQGAGGGLVFYVDSIGKEKRKHSIFPNTTPNYYLVTNNLSIKDFKFRIILKYNNRKN